MVWTGFEFLGDFSLFLQDRRVSKWPHPNNNRTKCDFRFALGEGLPFPRPGRFVCQMFSVPGELTGRAYPVIDLDVSGEFQLFGSSGVNEFGRTVELEVIQHLTADFPDSDSPGIEYHFTFKKVGKDDFNWTWYFESIAFPGGPIEIPMDVHSSTGGIPILEVRDDPQFLDVDWPEVDGIADFQWFGMSPCWDFSLMPPIIGGAQFNGTDAYVNHSQLMNFSSNPFIVEAEIRLHNVTTFWPIFGREAQGGFFGMDGPDIIFGNLRKPTTWSPVLDTWFTFKYEFEPVTQLQHKLTIAGTVVNDSTNARQFPQFDNLGVFKRTVPGTIWADMDMRNLKVQTGTPGNYTTLLDVPLIVNAIDAGPNSNDGTTFNMPLPST